MSKYLYCKVCPEKLVHKAMAETMDSGPYRGQVSKARKSQARVSCGHNHGAEQATRPITTIISAADAELPPYPPQQACDGPLVKRVADILGLLSNNEWSIADSDSRLALIQVKTYSGLDGYSMSVVDHVAGTVLITGADYRDFGPVTLDTTKKLATVGNSERKYRNLYKYTEGMLLIRLKAGGRTYNISRRSLFAERLVISATDGTLGQFLRGLPQPVAGNPQIYLFVHPALSKIITVTKPYLLSYNDLQPYQVGDSWQYLLAEMEDGWVRLIAPEMYQCLSVVGDTDYFDRITEFVDTLDDPDTFSALFNKEPTGDRLTDMTTAYQQLRKCVNSSEKVLLDQEWQMWQDAWQRLLTELSSNYVIGSRHATIRAMIKSQIDPNTLDSGQLRPLLLWLALTTQL